MKNFIVSSSGLQFQVSSPKTEWILVSQRKEGLVSYGETPGCRVRDIVAVWVVGVRSQDVFRNPDRDDLSHPFCSQGAWPPALPASPLNTPHVGAPYLSVMFPNLVVPQHSSCFYISLPLYLFLGNFSGPLSDRFLARLQEITQASLPFYTAIPLLGTELGDLLCCQHLPLL